MFTGIILATGRLAALDSSGGDLTLQVDTDLDTSSFKLGDSISVQGVCLTVTAKRPGRFAADVSRETMAKTTLARLQPPARVNLEPSLRVGDALGGHWVTGHVDTVARLRDVQADARSWRMHFDLPFEYQRFVAAKGSICVDGVSLTVNGVDGRGFDVNIIPHTYGVTTLGEARIGDSVNIEIDVVARYLERLYFANGRQAL